MQFVILIYETAAEQARRETEDRGAYFAPWGAYATALREAGVMVGGNALELPATGSTVQLRDGRRMVQDGPYADTREQLGGYFVIDVADATVALDWAARCPAAPTGVVEIRPVMSM